MITEHQARPSSALRDHSALIHSVCLTAGSPTLVSEATDGLGQLGVRQTVSNHVTAIFDWLVDIVSYQGVSDQVAEGYLAKHGSIGSWEIEGALDAAPSCQKLSSYWQFDHCGYRKTALTCSQPDHLPDCPLPLHNLRNGNLNQAAYGLFLLIRDVANL